MRRPMATLPLSDGAMALAVVRAVDEPPLVMLEGYATQNPRLYLELTGPRGNTSAHGNALPQPEVPFTVRDTGDFELRSLSGRSLTWNTSLLIRAAPRACRRCRLPGRSSAGIPYRVIRKLLWKRGTSPARSLRSSPEQGTDQPQSRRALDHMKSAGARGRRGGRPWQPLRLWRTRRQE